MNWSKDRSIALSRGCVVLFMILLAALDLLFIDQRLFNKRTEKSRSHGRLCLIENPEQGSALLFFP